MPLITNMWILFNAILYIGIGVLTLIKPDYVAKTIGYILSRPGGYAELRACYGGLMIMIGVFITYLKISNNKEICLLFLTTIYFGFWLGRCIGILFDKAYDQTTVMYFMFETFATILSFVLYYKQVTDVGQ